MSPLAEVLKYISIIIFGFYGLIFFFADLGPGETQFIRLGIAFGYFLLTGTIVNLFFYPKWKHGFFILWAVALVSVVNFKQSLVEGQIPILLNLAMLAVPLLAIVTSMFIVKHFKR